jgi:hypothetical protein
MLAPIRDRIALNYWSIALHITRAGFRAEITRGMAPASGLPPGDIQQLGAQRDALSQLRYEPANPAIEPIFRLARTNLAGHDRLLEELSEIDADLRAFRQTRELRRQIDIAPLLHENVW